MNLHEMIAKLDTEDQFKVLSDSYKQIEYAWNNDFNTSAINTSIIKNIILTGLGGSAIGGDLIHNYLRSELNYPYSVNRNYELPRYVNEETLLIVSSYSGNTEETISALNEAIRKKCQIVCVSTGGTIEQIAKKNKIPFAELQKGFQPRYALWINFFTLLKTLHSLKLVPSQSEDVQLAIGLLKRKSSEYSTPGNKAVEIAEKLLGFIPVVYSVSDYSSAVAARWKGQINENSKQHAFFGYLPELNHNEILGWEGYKTNMNFKLINILDDDYHIQVKKRFELTSEMVRKAGAEIINIISDEENIKLRLVDMIYLGDWVTYYYGIMRGYDPTSIDSINYLKEHL
ncbi:MAG: bifunctional phosphoglucose/phosphomannose isomerase [Ignavibacteriae bacterium HGW-Ignavibacteriae-3]|nr:MAG: bifunctional phosphoglucose/phosphomannose isomerase [Ignavibacteriae bacterium HGW-Ignavibacteriae-3]